MCVDLACAEVAGSWPNVGFSLDLCGHMELWHEDFWDYPLFGPGTYTNFTSL